MSDTTETTRTFGKAEHDAFDRYAQRLLDLLPADDREGVVLARDGGTCAACGLRVPPGIPKPFVGTDRAACPACVFARSMDAAIVNELASTASSVDEAARERLFSWSNPPKVPSTSPRSVGDAMKAKRGPVEDRIARAREAMTRSTTDEERTALARHLAKLEHERNGIHR